ncbi:T9SS type B sorting domain-containing protein [Flavobacterium sp. UMI-01]|uniref:T9SS type B sorting domain-containing protein n=1 Tax=Flavobacterium sp. UMI-01 TaxID=1441053 RepID=UPI001C7D37AD|nr:T9SS type B sorting domain-containing protein [Flavobacterium sp. UMI-01]GIZ10501.1 hypothetical protein FUMI01_32250 [Flavobacterium sp. UMI-01]
MKKNTKSFYFLFLVVFFLNTNLYANNFTERYDRSCYVLIDFICFTDFEILAPPPPPPTVNSPIYYCQNSPASPLTATPSAGNTLRWYTTPTGGTFSTTAPTPSTATVGSTSYYVSETDGVTESSRVQIVVNVVADNGSSIIGLTCDPTQITAPSTRYNAVFFDWTNTIGLPNQYTYFYTVDGGTPVNGTTGPTNLQVTGLTPGQAVTLTVWHTTYPCDRSVITCTVPCDPATTPVPNFAPIASICQGGTAPVLQPTSPNGISGTWSPAVINTTTPGTTNYVFTPNPAAHPCATTQTLPVTISPTVTMSFTSIPATVCQGATYNLPTSSNNTPPVTGTWSPSTVSTATLGSTNYTFTANPGQCTSAPNYTTTITVIPNNVTPTFTAVGPICSGDVIAPLPTTSNEGITGTWTPALNNTTTTNYTFTPNPGQCALSTTMTITVNNKVTPTFTAVAPICSGDALSPLPTTSNNSISGTWSPVLDNTKTTTYTFTPNTGQCANLASLTIIVNPIIEPDFKSVPPVVCEGAGDYILPTSSENNPSITGTWSPSFVDSGITGTLNYTFTPDAGFCASTVSIPITVKPSNTLVDFQWTVTEAFAENQIITINASAPGDYLYQLDFGPLQSSPVFERVSYGLHSVTVVDPDGCSASITKSDILVVNFPRYFTPNGDGYNDTWNIETLKDDLTAKIRIFDRYGKFLVEIKPTGNGWNGMYNNNPLPATDYWFVIDYIEDSTAKTFRSHFSLKR